MMGFETGDGFPHLVVSSGWGITMDVLGRQRNTELRMRVAFEIFDERIY